MAPGPFWFSVRHRVTGTITGCCKDCAAFGSRRSPRVAHATSAHVGLGALAELAVELPHQRPAARHPELGAGRDDPEVGCGLGAANDEACDRRKAEERRAGLRGVLPVVRPGGAAERRDQRAVPGGDWSTTLVRARRARRLVSRPSTDTGLTQATTVSVDASIPIALSAAAPTYAYTINAGEAFEIVSAGNVNNSASPNCLKNVD